MPQASGYLTPHSDFQSKFLWAFYAIILSAVPAASRRGLWEMFLEMFPSRPALKVLQHQIKQKFWGFLHWFFFLNFICGSTSSNNVADAQWCCEAFTQVSDWLMWTSSVGWGFYSGGLAAMQWRKSCRGFVWPWAHCKRESVWFSLYFFWLLMFKVLKCLKNFSFRWFLFFLFVYYEDQCFPLRPPHGSSLFEFVRKIRWTIVK